MALWAVGSRGEPYLGFPTGVSGRLPTFLEEKLPKTIIVVMPELPFQTMVLQTMHRNFGNDPGSSAPLQSLVGAPRGIVLQGKGNRASLATASQGDHTEEFPEGFRGRFRTP